MTRFSLTAALAAAFVSAAVPALANDPLPSSSATFEVYSKQGDWTVYTVSDRSSCLAEKVFDGGEYVMQIGATADETKGYMGFFTTADVVPFRRQKVELKIDGKTFESRAVGFKNRKLSDNYTGGYVPVRTQALIDALATGKELTVVPNKSFTFQIDLAGIDQAMAKGSECIKAQK